MKTIHKVATCPMKPPAQHNLRLATERALETLQSQSAEQMSWLGGRLVGEKWRLDVLDDVFCVDVSSGGVLASNGKEVSPAWRILTLHYLAVKSKPPKRIPSITFANLPAGRTYGSVYEARVNRRLCATAGRDGETLRAAAAAVGGRAFDAGDAAFDITIFPHVSTRLIWYAGDEEFPASATLLLSDNIDSVFCIEDIVVMSESLVSRLSGRHF